MRSALPTGLLIALLLLNSCRAEVPPDPLPEGLSEIKKDYATTGQIPQSLRIWADWLFVVNSGDNTVQRIDLASGHSEKRFIVLPLADDQTPPNPWAIAVVDGQPPRAYVTCYLTDAVAVVDPLAGGKPLDEIRPQGDALSRPQAVIHAAGLVIVANTAFHYPEYGQGSITVIDPASNTIVNRIPTTQHNPQALASDGDRLYVVNTGALCSRDGLFQPCADGGVDIVDLDDIRSADAPLGNIPLAALDGSLGGAPGDIAISPDGKSAYISSSTVGYLYVLDLGQLAWTRGPQDPIQPLDVSTNNLLSVAVLPSGRLTAVSFNTDELLLFGDAANEQDLVRADLGFNNTLEGPIDVVARAGAEAVELYVIMGISNRVVRVLVAP